ncbi:ECF-type sigma factor [Marinicella meishanensis]|uniref:ECF-type sigma factor n=1 Tax=Marinicella meishanensis TaxID=2873263 RepID=UPI001CBF1DC0|nr:ECF-type sigma factor [Marinicella sp. NBU2979]
MTEQPTADITALLVQAQDGNQAALDQLVQMVYLDLKKLARGQRQKIMSHTINTTGLVHEAWEKMHQGGMQFNNKNHFMAVAALAMRHLLINEAKKKQAQKRQHEGVNTYDSAIHGSGHGPTPSVEWLLQLDQGLQSLKAHEPRLEQVFVLIYFAGLTEAQVAELLAISDRTVRRDWVKAKLMLAMHLT